MGLAGGASAIGLLDFLGRVLWASPYFSSTVWPFQAMVQLARIWALSLADVP